jgi:hypothetical protein
VLDTVNRSVIDDRFFRDADSGGVNVLGRTILVSSGDVFSPFGFKESLREIADLLSLIDKYPDRLMLVQNGDDIRAAQASRRVGIYVRGGAVGVFEEYCRQAT